VQSSRDSKQYAPHQLETFHKLALYTALLLTRQTHMNNIEDHFAVNLN